MALTADEDRATERHGRLARFGKVWDYFLRVALCEVAERLCAVVRREDTVARVGGDEFVILLSDLNTDARAAVELVANKCLGVFQQPFVIHDQAYRLGTSIGIAIGHGEYSPDQLLIAADQAMYRAKEAGRGQFFWAMDPSVCQPSWK